MRRIERSAAFRRDFKRIASAPKHGDLARLLADALDLLVADKPLPAKNKDHQLAGSWGGYRECHIKPDLLLIYRRPAGALYLARLGSHSDLFRK
jgi:mRNA interferase YafQ